MNKSLLSIVAASALLVSLGFASAQPATTTTTTWTPEQGTTITTYSTTQKYTSFSDPALTPTIGMALPPTVTIYPLPDTVRVMPADRYSYGIINNRPVAVERTTRQVVHTW